MKHELCQLQSFLLYICTLLLLPPRSTKQASTKQLKQAATLLKAAGGVQWVDEGGQATENALIPKQAMVGIHPGLHVAAKTHSGALKELSKIYMQGGCLLCPSQSSYCRGGWGRSQANPENWTPFGRGNNL